MAGPALDPALAANIAADPAGLGDMLVVLPLVIPIVTGALLVMLRHSAQRHAAVAAVGLLALFAADVALLVQVIREGPQVMAMGAWKPPFGIAFTADLFGTTFAATSALVALAVSIYSGPTINTHERRYGFYPFLMLLMTGVTGAFLTGDIFNLYVWFEVLLIASFGLLVLGSEKAQIDGTVKYGILNLIATTLFLIATGLLYGVLGTLNMADIAIRVRDLPDGAPMTTIAALYLLAFGTKAAAFPANFWLPASYHTPGAGVSALFAAMLTKVGVYALAKTLILILAPQGAELSGVLVWVAGATTLVGAFGALAQSELRRLLGWLVISGIGTMLIGVAVGGQAGLTGMVLYGVHSMLVMAALYLAAGMVEEMSGSGDLRRLGGLQAFNPAFAASFLVLSFAVAGLPPFSGFWPKAVLFDAASAAGAPGLAFIVLANGFLVSIAMARVYLFAFWRGGPDGTADGDATTDHLAPLPDEDRAPRLVPIGLLTGLVVLYGLVPAPLYGIAEGAARTLLDPAGFAAAVFGAAP
jgi:multicomponent Na+:H+ antiporter subunit D